MSAVMKSATVVAIGERAAIPGPADPHTGAPARVPTMSLTIVLGKGTAGEQRSTFMLLESDYDALGRPAYGAAIDVTLTNPAI